MLPVSKDNHTLPFKVAEMDMRLVDLTSHENRPWRALTAILAGAFMINLDGFILNVAVPNIRNDLDASLASMELVVAGYAMIYGSFLVLGGRIGDLYGRRRTYLVGLIAFVATSVLCGLAPTSEALIAARLFQGAAAAIVMPQVFTLIRVGFLNDRDRGHAFAFLGGALGLSTIVGQIAGGVIAGSNVWGLEWRLVFLINIPIGLVTLVASAFWIEESKVAESHNLDLIGGSLSVITLMLFFFGLGEGRESGWSWWSLVMLLSSLLLAILFFHHQSSELTKFRQPLIDVKIFRNFGFSSGVILVFLLYSALAPFNFFLAIYLQDGVGLRPLEAGSTFIFAAAPFLTGSIIAGRLIHRWERAVVGSGALLVIIASAGLCWTLLQGEQLKGLRLYVGLMVMGSGYGLLETPLLNSVLSKASTATAGMASGIVNTMRQFGAAIGITLVGMLFMAMLGKGYEAAFLWAVGYQVAVMLVLIAFCSRPSVLLLRSANGDR